LPGRAPGDRAPGVALALARGVVAGLPRPRSARARPARGPRGLRRPAPGLRGGRRVLREHAGRELSGLDLLVLSEVPWGYFRTRKQFLLSRFPETWRVFFAQPPAAGADDPWEPRREGRVTVFTVPFLKPGTTSPLYNAATSLAAGRGLIEWGAERYLRRMLARLGVEPRPVVLAANIYTAA